MMIIYDVILTLGNGFTDNWGVPDTVANRLRNVAHLYKHNVSDKILLSGGYSISWDVIGIKPPTTEAGVMKLYLTGRNTFQISKVYLQMMFRHTFLLINISGHIFWMEEVLQELLQKTEIKKDF